MPCTEHADSFLDVPRLSTLQALLIVLKAREAAPKRGYYYRSWMAIVQCVQMGKDLGLDEHYADHKAGRSCGSGPAECLMKTRIWQTIFVCELMIGSPQGTVPIFSAGSPAARAWLTGCRADRPLRRRRVGGSERTSTMPGVDESEYHISRNFVYLVRIIGNISRLSRAYARVKKNKDWGLDSEITKLNPLFHSWLTDLPPDMTVNIRPDGAPPWLPSPYLGNVHSYYYLSVIMLHRPQLQLLDPTNPDGQWKHHMMICYSSAKLLCRLEEAILQSFGLTGLRCMQRGVNFTILRRPDLHRAPPGESHGTRRHPCGRNADSLSQVALHLSRPGPKHRCPRILHPPHARAREVHERLAHGRHAQADHAMREAFSADTRKPFVLKPSFPYGSPQSSTRPSPPGPHSSFLPVVSRSSPMDHHIDTAVAAVSQHSQVSYAVHPISPPISAGPGDSKSDGSSPTPQSLVMMAASQVSQAGALPQTLSLQTAPPGIRPGYSSESLQPVLSLSRGKGRKNRPADDPPNTQPVELDIRYAPSPQVPKSRPCPAS